MDRTAKNEDSIDAMLDRERSRRNQTDIKLASAQMGSYNDSADGKTEDIMHLEDVESV